MRPPSREYKPPFAHDMQVIQELMPSTNMEMRQTNSDNRPPSSDMRPLAEYRTQPPDPRANYEIMQSAMMHESTKLRNIDARNTLTQDARHVYYDAKHTEAAKQNTPDSMKHTVARIDGRNTLAQEIRIVYYDAKHTETAKQDMPDNVKHAIARNIVVGGPDFRSPSPNTGNPKPQAEFLQPSNGPTPNYVR
jgi:DNA topoisomerase VI subunit A